jgi:hypothetical protein
MSRVHSNDVSCEKQCPFTHLSFSNHQGSEVTHGLGIVVRICDLSQWVRSIVLRDGDNVFECWTRVIDAKSLDTIRGGLGGTYL